MEESTLYLAASPHTRAQVLTTPCPVPATPGSYGWWFRELPAEINTSGCAKKDGLTLLYPGISPSALLVNGKAPSKQTLRTRIKTHYRGNAAGSTLRLALGCLMSDQLGVELRLVGSGKRLTFVAGEKVLSEWMAENALVSWVLNPEPWVLEHQLISSLDGSFNLDATAHNSFFPTLKAARQSARDRARELPVVPNPGVGGK